MAEDKTVRSALCVVLPCGVMDAVQAIRREHDRSFGRWPPHVNLLYPFVPEAAAGAHVAALSAALRDMLPFRVTFGEFKHFRHTQRSYTLWLEPAPREQFLELQRRVQRVFPALTDLSTIEAFGYTPHLSLGQWHSQAALDAAKAAYARTWRPVACVVDAVHIITRHDDLPFAVHLTVPFGGRTPFAGPPPGLMPVSPLLAVPSAANTGTGTGTGAGAGAPSATPRKVYAWAADAGAWRPLLVPHVIADAAGRPALGDVRVATWNVFHDADNTALLNDGARRGAVVAHIAALAARSDVLVLTEMTDALLAALLQQDWLRADFFISDVPQDALAAGTTGTASTAVAQSFVLVAARRAFRHLSLAHSASKRSVLAVFPEPDGVCARLVVAGVHLTSNFRASAQDTVAVRVRQLSALAAALAAEECPAAIAGDFNIADGSAASTETRALRALLPGFADAWRAVHGRDPGCTFDPRTNRTAAATTRTHVPARYDRVLVQTTDPSTSTSTGTDKGSEGPAHHWEPAAAEIVRPPALAGDNSGYYVSDHYSLVASVAWRAGPGAPPAEPVTTVAEYLSARDDAAAASEQAVARALRVLQRAVAACGAPRIFVAPAGSYGMRTRRAGGDVDLVCVSAEPRDAFFRRLGTQLLGLRCPCGAAVSAVVPVLRTTVRGVAFELQHCRVPQRIVDALPQPVRTPDLFRALRTAQLAPPPTPRRPLNNSSSNADEVDEEEDESWDEAGARALCGWADAQAVTAAVPEALHAVFAGALAVVKQWAVSRGVYSCRMGYPGGIGYTIMVARLVQKAAASAGSAPLTVAGLVAQFFAVYAGTDFATTPLALAGAGAPGGAARTGAAKMVVWTPAKPHYNVTRNSTRASVWCLRHELAAAQTFLERAGGVDRVDWEVFLEQNHHRPLLKSPHTVALVLVTVSALTRPSFDAWASFVESRLVRLTVALECVCPPGLVPVLYSRAFYNPAPTYPHQCCFLAVLYDASGNSPFASMEPDAATKEFLAPAQSWEHSVLVQKPGDGFISVWCYSTEKMPKWLLADGAVQCSPSASQDDDDDEDAFDVSAFVESLDNIPSPEPTSHTPEPAKPVPSPAHPKGAAAAASNKQHGGKTAAAPTGQTPATKLRTSEDVYNRIMWDPLLNKAEYTICYEDRFLGLMEIPFESFDRENIPFHRVWMFKHRGDVVWDREKRIDLVF